MDVTAFFDPKTGTLTYIVSDPQTRDAVIIDSVLDFCPRNVRIDTESLKRLYAHIAQKNLSIRAILDTHAHADHLSGMARLKERYPEAVTVVGSRFPEVQAFFTGIFDCKQLVNQDGSQFDRMLENTAIFDAGSLQIQALHTPGHTPACVTYKIEDALFTGDAMLMPDSGTGRCDFPNGSAEVLYESVVEQLYTLPDETRVFVGHDYQPGGRKLQYETTIGQAKRSNTHLRSGTTLEEFTKLRTKRDATLDLPTLIFPSIQVNINGGAIPSAHANGISYLQLPINVL